MGLGSSGALPYWHYEDWREIFYPPDLPRHKWLEFYSRRFATVEINNSFYHLPSEAAFANWARATPAGFTFAVKVSRFITHIKKLKDIKEAEDTFVQRARKLGDKLGPLLYQLPPGLHRDDSRLEEFLAGLPGGLKHVIEFRHQSWLEEPVFNILRRYRVGLCIFDMPAFRCPMVATADFAYIRFHGSERLYSSSYTDAELADWVNGLTALATSLETVYLYFNNDVAGFALDNALTLRKYLEQHEEKKIAQAQL